MKHSTRIAAWLLASLTLLPTVLSCGDSTVNSDTNDSTVSTTEAATETVDPNDRSQVKDSLPDNLDFKEREFRIHVANVDYNDDYIGGPEEETGEIVEDAVYQRNRTVSERLNVKILSDGFEFGWDTISAEISKLVMAGDGTYDVFMGQQAGVAKLITENCFINAFDVEHLDFTQPWWNNAYMDEPPSAVITVISSSVTTLSVPCFGHVSFSSIRFCMPSTLTTQMNSTAWCLTENGRWMSWPISQNRYM